jgi:hypothetical protein
MWGTGPRTNPPQSQKTLETEIAAKIQVFSVSHWVGKIGPAWTRAATEATLSWAQLGPSWNQLVMLGWSCAQIDQMDPKLKPCSDAHESPCHVQHGATWDPLASTLFKVRPNGDETVHLDDVGTPSWSCTSWLFISLATKLPRLSTFGAGGFFLDSFIENNQKTDEHHQKSTASMDKSMKSMEESIKTKTQWRRAASGQKLVTNPCLQNPQPKPAPFCDVMYCNVMGWNVMACSGL